MREHHLLFAITLVFDHCNTIAAKQETPLKAQSLLSFSRLGMLLVSDLYGVDDEKRRVIHGWSKLDIY